MTAAEKTVQINGYYLYKTLQYIPAHNITYLEWGDPSNQDIIVCAHGLTRNAHDFDKIAAKLCADFRIIAINYPGRDTSDCFDNVLHYNYFTYVEDTVRILKKLHIKNPIWLGTSMGGIIGMFLAKKFKALILNDIGPIITHDSLSNIKKYTSEYPAFDTLEEAKEHIKSIYKYVGITEEGDWDELTKHSFRLMSGEGKRYQLNYDHKITAGIRAARSDIDLMLFWNQIPCSILIIHGEKSRILTATIVAEMQRTKKAALLRVKDVGHPPALTTEEQINYINSWIKALPTNSSISNKGTTGAAVYLKDVIRILYKKVRSKL